MAHLQYLVMNGICVPMPVSYEVRLSDVEADSGGLTEAGTLQRDVVREGVVQIWAVFHVSSRWLRHFSEFKRLASLQVGYLDPATMERQVSQMYIDGYRVRLVRDTSYGGLWEVRFVLREF